MTDRSSASIGTLRSLPPLPLTWMVAARFSVVVRISPMSARRSSSERRPGQEHSEDEREISFSPISLAFRTFVSRHSLQQSLHRGAGESLGERPGQLRSPDKLHGVSSQLLTRIEEGAQHIPRRPTAANRRCFVITRIRCERTAHRILRYVSYGELR